MTCIVSSGALNSTHSLSHSKYVRPPNTKAKGEKKGTKGTTPPFHKFLNSPCDCLRPTAAHRSLVFCHNAHAVEPLAASLAGARTPMLRQEPATSELPSAQRARVGALDAVQRPHVDDESAERAERRLADAALLHASSGRRPLGPRRDVSAFRRPGDRPLCRALAVGATMTDELSERAEPLRAHVASVRLLGGSCFGQRREGRQTDPQRAAAITFSRI